MFRYIIRYYDSDMEMTVEEDGLVLGPTWSKAAKRITNHYGPKNVMELRLFESEKILYGDELRDWPEL